VVAWFKSTNGVISGCGNDLFEASFEEQTRCILSRINDRQGAYDIVGRCLADVSLGPTLKPTRAPTTMPPMLQPTRSPTAMPSMRQPTPAPTESAPACAVTEAGSAQLATNSKCQAACRLLPQGWWPCGGGSHPCVCDTALPTPYPSLVPTPIPTPYPSPSQSTPMPTPYPSPEPTLQPATSLPTSIPPASDCVDYAGKVCRACLASNKVCYTESQEWCDIWSQYRWCGVSRRLLSVPIGDTVML
jgi:hypothetical protein